MNQVAEKPSLGTGIYTVAEAARLLKVSPRKVAGWAKQYVNHRDGEIRVSPPILDRTGNESGLITFHDLVELFFVREFRNAGVSLPHIRGVARILRESWGTPYPFAEQRLAELGRRLVDREDMKVIMDKQQVFQFAQDFFQDFDFDATGLAKTWSPLGKEKLIVLDPHRSFGAPIDIRSGVRTDVLYGAYQAEGNVEAVAQWYEVAREAVDQAIEFEVRWRKAA